MPGTGRCTCGAFFRGGVLLCFKKCMSLMRYACRLLFYILCRLPFVSASLLMLYSVLIHTSLLINYSIYPLIRYPDRVNNCFAVLWDVALYQASSNSQWISLAPRCFRRLVDIQGSKHLARLLAITRVFCILCQKTSSVCKIHPCWWVRESVCMNACAHACEPECTHVCLPSPICVCTNRLRCLVVSISTL